MEQSNFSRQDVDEIDVFKDFLKGYFPSCKILVRGDFLVVTQDSVNAILKFKHGGNAYVACVAMVYTLSGLANCSEQIWTVSELKEYLKSQHEILDKFR
jgi:hypothetical protein